MIEGLLIVILAGFCLLVVYSAGWRDGRRALQIKLRIWHHQGVDIVEAVEDDHPL